MRKKLLLLLAVSMSMASSAWALEKDGDVYQIGTAQDLRDFATAVNGGEYGASAVLTANINLNNEAWTPIGNAANPYTGTFDGQGYKIEGFNATSNGNNGGFFGKISSATVKNFSIDGSFTIEGGKYEGAIAQCVNSTVSNVYSSLEISVTGTTASHMGGVVGSTEDGNGSTISNCVFSGSITLAEGISGSVAGVVGYMGPDQIINCANFGSITYEADGCNAGGIVAYVNNKSATVKNCLNTGVIQCNGDSPTYGGAIIGRIKKNYDAAKILNNYWLEGSATGAAKKDGDASFSLPTSSAASVTAKQLASGEIAYALNGKQSETVNWFQKLGTDNYPTPYGSDIVYLTGHFHCDGSAYEGQTAYSNSNESTKDEHNFIDGICSYCNLCDVSYMTPNTDGIYEIGTAYQLRWFAAFVNMGGDNISANAVLTNDINMEGVSWPNAIGNFVNSIAYKGHFDGQGHKIENLKYTTNKGYHGFFGVLIDGAVVENFSIYGDVINEEFDAIAPIAYAKNQTDPVYIRNIHSYLNITSSGSDKKVGGILGNGNNGTTYVDRCVFSGTLKSTNKTNCGGIAAYIQNNATSFVHITNCLFDGRIESTASDAYCGGILGYIGANNSVYTITNCLSVGTFDAPVAGSIFGYAKNKGAGSSNNYIISGGTTYGKVSDNCSATDNLATEVTADQLASGQVAYKLGDAFGLLIGTDKVPSPLSELAVSYVGEVGYATFFDAAQGYKLNGDVEAYAGMVKGQYVSLTSIGKMVPAAMPVVLKGTYYNKVAADVPSVDIVNNLKGSDGTVKGDGSIYVLANDKEKGVGFYLVTEGSAIPAGKAYLQTSNAVKEFFPFADDETAIESLTPALSKGEGAIYNIAGQRLSKMQKGLNIVGGKKVMY